MSAGPTGQTGQIRHIRGLDGLRGLALLGVLFFHANSALPGGYLGVDLFFVLSGFLITSLLLAERKRTGRIDLRAFWIRRARRLFPALLSLMPAIAIYARFVAKPADLHNLRVDALATLGYVANWSAIFSKKSYWELFASPSPLEHTWSLSIEEQFYVVWPIVVALVLWKRTPAFLRNLSIALGMASAAAMVLLYNPERVSRVYLGTDTRATAILAGAVLATLVSPETTFSKRAVRLLDAVGVVSFVGLAYAWWHLDGQSYFLYHGGFWITEIAALLLVVCALAGSESLVARGLSLRPLTWVGTISYGLYLWHWPVNVLLTAERVHFSGLPLQAARFAITFAIAIVSYRYFELPIRKHGLPFGRPMITVPAAVIVTVLLVVRGTYARQAPPGSPYQTYIAPFVPFETGPRPITFRVDVFGDSTANSLGWTLRGMREPGLEINLFGKDGCTMLGDTCEGEEWARHVSESRANTAFIFFGGAFLHGVTAHGQWMKSCHKEWAAPFETSIEKHLRELTPAMAKGTRVVLATIPYPLGPYDDATFRRETDCINESILKVAAHVPGVEIADVFEALCPKGECKRELHDVVIRPDGVHYSMDGALDLAKWLRRQIAPEHLPDIDTEPDLDGGAALVVDAKVDSAPTH